MPPRVEYLAVFLFEVSCSVVFFTLLRGVSYKA